MVNKPKEETDEFLGQMNFKPVENRQVFWFIKESTLNADQIAFGVSFSTVHVKPLLKQRFKSDLYHTIYLCGD